MNSGLNQAATAPEIDAVTLRKFIGRIESNILSYSKVLDKDTAEKDVLLDSMTKQLLSCLHSMCRFETGSEKV
jgi:hypothetical protein